MAKFPPGGISPQVGDHWSSGTRNMEIFLSIICMISCQWAQPYWQPGICAHGRDSRECDVLCVVGSAAETGRSAPSQCV